MRLGTASCTFARPFACILCFRAAARQIAGDRYQHCIKQDWAKKEGVERCNKEFGQALATAYWSSWAQLAFIPVGLAWFMGWGLSFLVRRVRSGPQAGRKVALPMANDDENAFGSGKKPMTNCGLLGQKPYSRPSLCSLLANFLHASPDIAATRSIEMPMPVPATKSCLEATRGMAHFGNRQSSVSMVSTAGGMKLCTGMRQSIFFEGGQIRPNLIAGNYWDRGGQFAQSRHRGVECLRMRVRLCQYEASFSDI